MKALLKVLAVILVVFGLGIAAIFYFTRDMVEVADSFFTKLSSGDVETVEDYLSEAFKLSTSMEELKAYADANHFFEFTEASWNTRTISGNQGHLDGSITTDSGMVVPLTLSFIKENGKWKIYTINKTPSGIQENAVVLTAPPDDELVVLVQKTMDVFARSVNDKNMQAFYDYTSMLWHEQTTPQELQDAFQVFIDNEIDFSVLKNYSPIFKAKPEIDEQGSLNIFGVYNVETKQVHFEHNYVFEGLSWKLFGLDVSIE